MTIAISIKVNDGVILAADSAASMIQDIPGGPGGKVVTNLYEHADKVFCLRKGQRIGAITWGIGALGNASVSTLLKDFRQGLLERVPDLSIDQASRELAEYIHRGYASVFGQLPPERCPSLGFMVAGYSPGKNFAEEWRFDIVGGQLRGPDKMRGDDESGITWNGEAEAISRLLLGFGTGLEMALRDMKVDDELIAVLGPGLRERLMAPMVHPAMPIQDAIDLAGFLVDTTIKFHRFVPGAPTVGGAVDVAAITKHEGFQWVHRKHYYDPRLNPPEPDPWR